MVVVGIQGLDDCTGAASSRQSRDSVQALRVGAVSAYSAYKGSCQKAGRHLCSEEVCWEGGQSNVQVAELQAQMQQAFYLLAWATNTATTSTPCS